MLIRFHLVPERLDDCVAQAVHHGQAFPKQNSQDGDDEHQGEDDVVAFGALLVLDEVGEVLVADESVDEDLEGDHDEAADEDDEEHFVDSFDGGVDFVLEHDAGHDEVEVEEGGEEGEDDEGVDGDGDVVEQLVLHDVDVEQHQRDEEGEEHHHFQGFDAHRDASGVDLR